jgi:hypothetical protein
MFRGFFLGVRILYFVMLKRIRSVIASVLAPGGVDRGFEQTFHRTYCCPGRALLPLGKIIMIPNQPVFKAACLTEKQPIPILYSLRLEYQWFNVRACQAFAMLCVTIVD